MVVRLSPTQTQQAALIAFVSDAWNNGIYICIYIYVYIYIYIKCIYEPNNERGREGRV